jgi:hypothetical protein
MKETRAELPAAEFATPKPRNSGGWPLRRWLTLIALAFAAHIVLIFVFGAKRLPSPRAGSNVPHLALADRSSGLVALDDPTLFALPQARDLAAAGWRKMSPVKPPSSRWIAPPGELASPVAENLGAVFRRFMQTNRFAAFPLDFKPKPELSEPELAAESVLPRNSRLQITGDLAHRRLLGEINLPSLPANNVLVPIKVQVLVDPAGNVVSAVLLPPANAVEAAGRAEVGDTNALLIARSLRFVPADRPTFGELIFNWRTVPAVITNEPAKE